MLVRVWELLFIVGGLLLCDNLIKLLEFLDKNGYNISDNLIKLLQLLGKK